MTEIFKTVLFPIDQSRETREAADVVINIVKKYSSRLVLLSVVEEASPDAPTKDPMVSPEVVAKLLASAQSLFSGQGIQSEILERQGKPAFTICRGLGLTEEGADDSVTTRVINLSPCPVLIVP